MGTKKNFVLDTNVILHDYNCLKNFQENDIYLPLVVLEELDKFKKGNEQIDVFEKSNEIFENVDPALIDRIYSSKEGIDLSEFDFKDLIHPNECFVLKSDRNSVLARYNPFTHSIIRVLKGKNYGIEPRNAEQSFAFEILNDPNIKLVALTGKAGTGKTLLALAAALGKLTDYKQILLARPVVALSNKDIGFLPGDAQEKVAPYMQPLFDNLNVIKRQFAANSTEVKRIEDMQKSEQLVIEALAFIRGRSLSEMYCIIDEAQNLTPNEIKTIITRAGEGTKMVFTGDIQQIDLILHFSFFICFILSFRNI